MQYATNALRRRGAMEGSGQGDKSKGRVFKYGFDDPT